MIALEQRYEEPCHEIGVFSYVALQQQLDHLIAARMVQR